MSDFTGNYQAKHRYDDPPRRTTRMSYEYRAGQVGAILAISSDITTYDIAKALGLSPRQVFNICRRMHSEGRIAFKTAPHAQVFKYLLRLPG